MNPFAQKELWAQRGLSSTAILGTPWGPVLQPLSLCYNQAYPPVAHKLECAYLWPCLLLTLHLLGDLLFARPKGALRLSARLIPNRKRRAFGAIVLSRINGPEHSSYPLPPPRPPPPSPPILFLLQFSSSSISLIPPVLLLLFQEPISAAERKDGLPWVELGVGGWLAEGQQGIWDSNMRQKRAPLPRKCIKHASP